VNKNEEMLQEMLMTVADALGDDLRKQLVFVGGCTTVLFVTDSHAKEDIRSTYDVDLIVDIAGPIEWVQLQNQLTRKGFSVSEGDMICRMRLGELKVDFMPADESILGFTNRWYRKGIDTAQEIKLPEGLTIKSLTPPLFIATKFEAYLGRGNNDPLVSHDLEDILILIDGRNALVSEIKNSDQDVRDYIADQIDALLRHPDIEFAVTCNVRGDEGRGNLIFNRLEAIINLRGNLQ
jgi:predicted nucleotidyltransferase